MNTNLNWSEMKSLKLSRVLVFGLLFMLIAALFLIPFIAKWYNEISTGTGIIGGDVTLPVVIMLYICDIFGLFAANSLRELLENISHEKVFINKNAACLRSISWCCVAVGCVFLFFGLWRFSIMFASFFAFFLGVVMRVLKNVFEKAIELKSENDFTI